LTDKKVPGNPTQSYRSRDLLRFIAEVTVWQGNPARAPVLLSPY
jgi:rifampin ADP-ribosylating transferase